MIYREFGKTGWNVSAIGQGCWNIGNQWGFMSDADADKILKTAYEQGINLFDVAESYGIPDGLSELRLGRALKGIREKVYIISKIGHWGSKTNQGVPKTTADMIRLCGHACAGRLGTSWIDVMLCHENKIEDPSIYIEGFEILKKEGFIREYGISTDSIEVLKKFYEMSDGHCSTVEVEYSLAKRQPEEDILPYCIEKGIAILIRGPFAKGVLSGKYDKDSVFTDSVRKHWNKGDSERQEFERRLAVAEKVRDGLTKGTDMATTALRYVISHPSSPVAIPGATSPEQVVSNVKAGERLLSKEEMALLR